MKKVLFSVLMISAMFMIASCGSKSNSGEAAAEEEVAKVEFADPAIVFEGGIDVTSNFSAESVSQPTIYKKSNIEEYHLSTNVKLKLAKKLDITAKDQTSAIRFDVRFLDNGGSTIASGYEVKFEIVDKLAELQEGTILSLDIKSKENEMFDSRMKELLNKVEKIEVGITTINYELKTEE